MANKEEMLGSVGFPEIVNSSIHYSWHEIKKPEQNFGPVWKMRTLGFYHLPLDALHVTCTPEVADAVKEAFGQSLTALIRTPEFPTISESIARSTMDETLLAARRMQEIYTGGVLVFPVEIEKSRDTVGFLFMIHMSLNRNLYNPSLRSIVEQTNNRLSESGIDPIPLPKRFSTKGRKGFLWIK